MNRRAFLGGFAIALAACHKDKPREDALVKRIVSISPSTTETVYAVGAGELLVGRSRYCDYPPEAEKLPQVGGYVDPSLEAILALRPDLVVGARGPAGDAITKKLEARGVATYFPETESLSAIDAMITGIGARVGRQREALAVVAKIAARVKGVEDAVRTSPRARVLLVFGLEPVAVAGPSSFADEMIRRAGGENAVRDGGAYPTISIEHVLALAPDVVINAAMAESHGHEKITKDSPGWGKVRAVIEGHVAALTDESVLRPGPRVGDGLAILAKAIHPGLSGGAL